MEKWKLVVMAAGAGMSVIGGLAVTTTVGAATVAPSMSSGSLYSTMMGVYCPGPAHGSNPVQTSQDAAHAAACAMPR